MQVPGSLRAQGRTLVRRLLTATVAVGALVTVAGAGAATRDAGVLVGDPASDDAFVRVLEGEREPLGAEGEPRRFYVELMLMRAQMRLGRELYRVGDREAGRAHFIAPAEAHLPEVRDALVNRNLERVAGRIEDLAAAARESDSWIDVQDLYATTRMSIRRAQREVDASLREDPAFQGDVLLAISDRAVRQFETAVDEGQVVDQVAYRVSWAYVQAGGRLLETFEGLLRMSDDHHYDRLVEHHERFVDLWPGRTPPDQVDVSVADMRTELEALAELVESDQGG